MVSIDVSGDRRATIAYQPALDGVRAIAVIAVLLFHGEVSWMSGGYLGVSVFFTLSGFLITSLMLAEHAATGTVSASAFYSRRVRRLLPASVLCLLLVSAFAAGGAFDGVDHLRRDIVGAALQVFNWVQLGSGESYTELFNRAGGAGTTPPLDHYWSLAIEEQFYWVWPLAFVGLTALARRRRWPLLTVMAALTALFAVAAPVIAQVWGPDAAYWATPARIAEILVGALAAVTLSARRVPARLAALAPVGLAVIVVACVAAPSGSGFAYEGALPLFAVASAGLIVGLQVDGPARRALSWAPLVWIGRVSYGIYLFHWPIYALLDENRLGVAEPVLLAIRLAVTAAVAALSFYVLEQPVRRARATPVRTLVPGLCATAVVIAAVAVVPAHTGAYWDLDDDIAASAGIQPLDSVAPLVTQAPSTSITTGATEPASTTTNPGGAAPASSTTATPATSTTTTGPLVPSRPVRIAVVGDSTAEATGVGLVRWADAHPDLAQVSLVTGPGCGFVLGGSRVFDDGEVDIDSHCREWVTEDIPELVAELRPDVVMMLTTSWDVLDHRWPDEGVLTPLDDAYGQRVRAAFADITEALASTGVSRIAWVRQPIPDPFWLEDLNVQEEPARHAVLYAAMDQLASSDSRVRVVDLAGWVAEAGLATDRDARPDGVHWSVDAATDIAERWLGQQLITAALEAST